MSWPIILLTPTNQASLALRRFSSQRCPATKNGSWIHDARTHIGTTDIIGTPESWEIDVPQPPRTDPRWPRTCRCGYNFQEKDTWQLTDNLIYTRSDNGEMVTRHETTAGMLWNAPYYLDVHGYTAGPDGQFLVMKLPDGTEWTVDGPSSSGGGWTRTGVPPLITVTPSILSPGYHGFVRDGFLTDDLEGRTYE